MAQPGCSWHGAMNNRERELRNMGLFSDGFKELKKASDPLYKAPKSIQETIEIMQGSSVLLQLTASLLYRSDAFQWTNNLNNVIVRGETYTHDEYIDALVNAGITVED